MNQPGRRAVLSEFQAREFAYGNRIYWLSRPAYANPAGVRAAFSQISGPAFAYGNRVHWLCGPAYANRAGVRAAFSQISGLAFAYGNRFHWLCGRAYANRAGVRAAFFHISGPAFAYGNRIYWLSRPVYANPAGARVAFSKISGPGSNTEKSDARSAVAFEHHFSLISYPILPLASAQRSAFEKTTYFFNTVLFSEPLFKKSIVFFNSQDWIRKLPSFLPSSQRLLCNSISTNV